MGLLVTDPAHGTTWWEGSFLSKGPQAWPCNSNDLVVFVAGTSLLYTPQVHLVFLCITDVAFFNELKARPSSSKNISTHCIVMFASLRRSGARHATSLQCAWSQKSTPKPLLGTRRGAAHRQQRVHSSPPKCLQVKLPRTVKLSKGEDQSAVIF